MNCGICLQDLPRADAYYLTCGHFYDLECIYKCSLNSDFCPECRKPLDKEKLRRDARPEHVIGILDAANVPNAANIPDNKFDQIYNSSIKPRDNQGMWKTALYRIYRETAPNGVFGWDERVKFVKELVYYQNKNSGYHAMPPMISVLNLVMNDYLFSKARKCRVIFSLVSWIAFCIALMLACLLLAVFESRLELKIALYCLFGFALIVYSTIFLTKLITYKSYNVSFQDYLRGHSIIASYGNYNN